MTSSAVLVAAEARLWSSLGIEPGERWVDMPRLGSRVRVQEVGVGPPVLLIHGGSTWGTSWADLAAALAPSRRCLLLDRPGTGRSGPLRDPIRSLDALRDLADRLLVDVIDALGLDAVDVVATSFGGLFAMRAALAAPDRIGRLVLLGWNAGAPVSRLPRLLRVGVLPIVGDLMARLPANATAVRGIFRAIGSGASIDDGRLSPEAIEAYVALLRATDTVRNDLALGRLVFSARHGMDPRLILTPAERAAIESPVAILWGGRDAFGDAAIAPAFAAPFRDVRLEILPDAGHALWVDDLDRVAAFVRSALDAQSEKRSSFQGSASLL